MNRWGSFLALAVVLGLMIVSLPAASTLSGRVTDTTGAVVPAVEVDAVNVETGNVYSVTTDETGLYVIANVAPGLYVLTAKKAGFATTVKEDVEIHVEHVLKADLQLQVGELAETVTVEAGAALVQSESAQVDTLVGREFIENLPLNGRSFHTLLHLTPGVVTNRSEGFGSQGSFSVNGQRANTNYFTVDGVSVNTGAGLTPDVYQFGGGTLPATTALGGYNNLASVDALEEFRIQTSTFAPEFGRQPGAQVQIRTRSGTNDFHGNVFWFFRNDVLDANDWFINRCTTCDLSGDGKADRPGLRQNFFGGSFGGPILKDRTFFFVSYEGLQLRQPRFAFTEVPSVQAREAAPPEWDVLLQPFPLPNVPNSFNPVTLMEGFQAPLTIPAKQNSFSLRVDHKLSANWNLFGRLSTTPSELKGPRLSLPWSDRFQQTDTQFLTLGLTATLSPTVVNETRFNWMQNRVVNTATFRSIGGNSRPPDEAWYPEGASSDKDLFHFSVGPYFYNIGPTANNNMKQVNLVENISLVRGSHELKFGADYRQTFPTFQDYGVDAPVLATYALQMRPRGAPAMADGLIERYRIFGDQQAKRLRYHNFSLYAQDTWRLNSRFTLTYGLRWEVNPPPTSPSGHVPFAADQVEDVSTTHVLPLGARQYKTTYNNFSPRIGMAYQVSQTKNLVLRGGYGLFYDLGSTNAAQGVAFFVAPYATWTALSNQVFPLVGAATVVPPFEREPPFSVSVSLMDPELKLPYSHMWNVALEKGLGRSQTISATYLGTLGRRLLRQGRFFGNPDFAISGVDITRNDATSDYHALQVQFQRRFSKGLSALASYSWSHSIDTASDATNFSVPADNLDLRLERGNSAFDVRHVFSMAASYEIPSPKGNSAARGIFGNWAMDTFLKTRTGFFLNPVTQAGSLDPEGGASRPDVVAGQPFWISDPNVPEGKRLNPDAFAFPTPGQQGNLGRNAIESFGLFQWDFSVRRTFPLKEDLQLQFKSDFFNFLNHPNFADPVLNMQAGLFGQSTQMLNTGLSPGVPSSGFSSFYQIGGPRSIQFSLKLMF